MSFVFVGRSQNLIINNGNVTNSGTIRVKSQAVGLPPAIDGVFEYFGANQNVPATQYKNLMLSGSGTKTTVGGGFSVSQNITIAAPVTLKTQTGTSITLIGDLIENGYLNGSIRKTEDLSGATTSANFGNIGATISWTGAAPGTTTVNRVSGVASTGNGNESILRYYDIAPTFNSGLNVTFVFRYADSELNGRDPNTLELWRSIDGGLTWRRQGGTGDPFQRTITKSGVQSLSRWTASDAAHLLGPSDYEWVAKNIALTSGSPASGQVNTVLPPFIVTVTDAYGNPISGTAVSFAISSTPAGASGQSLSVTNATTGADGRASTILTLGSVAGSYTVTATSAGLVGSPLTLTATATLPPPPPGPSSIALISGNNQSGPINTTLTNPFVVRVTNSAGLPASGISVTFAIVDTPANAVGQSLSVSNAVTNANGEALTSLKLGNKVGTYTVTATSSGLTGSPIPFTAQATPGAAATMVLTSGDGQIGSVSSTLPNPFVVTVADSGGNPVRGAAVTWSIASVPDSATGQSLNAVGGVTDSLGRASAVLKLGNKIGEYRVTANSSGLTGSPITFKATATVGTAAAMVLTSGEGQSGTVGTRLADPFVVTVRDSSNNPVPGVEVSWLIEQRPDSATGETLSAVNVPTDSSGRSSTYLTLGDKVGQYQVKATSSAIPQNNSVTFTATANSSAAAFLVEVSGDDQTGFARTRLTDPFVVTVTDSLANPVSGVNVAWSIEQTPDSATTGQQLTNVVSTTDSVGASSAYLVLGDKVGPYVVRAAAAGLSGSPITFTATAVTAPAVAMILKYGDGQSAPVTTGLPEPFVVFVYDTVGLPVSGVSVNWRITSAPTNANGQILTNTTSVTNDSGYASTVLRLGDKEGTYTVEATSPGLAGSPIAFTARATAGAVRVPVLIVSTSGNNQSTQINTQLPSPFVVQVIDNLNRPVPGVQVTFAIDNNSLPQGATGQQISLSSALTDSAGRASTVLTLGSKVGVYSVLASSPGLGNSPIRFNALATAGPPTSLVLSGDGQSRRISTTLAEPFVVGVYDAGGNPVPGLQVHFAIVSTPPNAVGQSLSRTTVLTDNSGQTSTTLTLGDQPGEYVVSVIVAGYSGSPLTFNATALALSASAIAQVSGSNQIGLIRATLLVPLTVRVIDPEGKPVDDVTVTFSFANVPPQATGHRLSVTTVKTDPSGQASTILTLGNKVGVYTVHATSPGLAGSPIVFTATALPGAALLQTSGQGQSGVVLTTLRNPFVVRVLDASGTPVPAVNVIWAITGKPTGAIGHTLSAAVTTTNDSGRAVAFMTLGNKIGTYTVTAASAGLSGSPVTFTAEAITSAGSPAILLLTSGNNQTAPVSTPLSEPLVVTVLDSVGRPVERANVTFTIDTDSLPSGAIGQSLSAINVPTDTSGRVATLLTLGNKVGTYRVFASVPGLVNSPLVFRATATKVPAAALVYLSGSNQSGRIRTTIAQPFVTVVFDAQGNPVKGSLVTFSIDSLPTGSAGHRLSTVVDTTDDIGLASTILTFGQKAGRYVVSASAPGLANSPLRFIATALPDNPSAVLAIAGNNQSKSVKETLDSALVVRVVDGSDNPVPGVIVSFLITQTPSGSVGHSLSSTFGITNSKGEASTVLTLGDKLGIYKVTASVVGASSVEFTAKTEAIAGDINGDRDVNIADLTTVIDHVNQKITLTGIDSIKADVNADGAITVQDVILLRDYLLGVAPSLSKSGTKESAQRPNSSALPMTASIRGEFEITKFGIRFNMENDVPVKGVQLLVRFKNVVPATIGSIDVIFSRARMMEMPVNTSGREMRVIAFNNENQPIEPGKGPLFRFPRELSNLNEIEKVELIVSTGEGIHEALRGPVQTVQQSQLPVNFKLEQNYPNPFNPATAIEFEVPDDQSGFFNVALVIYNQLGQEVKTMLRGELEAGRHKVIWDGTDDSGTRVASGVYYYRLMTRDFQSAKRMLLLR